MISLEQNQESTDQNCEEFKYHSLRLVSLLAKENIAVRPFLPGLPYFNRLTPQLQKEVIKSIKFYTDLCSEHVTEGYKLKDSNTFTWRAFRAYGLVPVSDLFSYIKSNDIIEVYSTENRQIFRNFQYFQYCSYSIEELYSVEWWHLFARDESITKKIMEEAYQVFNGETQGIFFSKTERHQVKELISQDKLSNFYKLKFLSALKANKRIEAVIAVIEVDSISA